MLDLQKSLEKQSGTFVPLTTLQHWVKKGLNYSYKRCNVIRPEINQVGNVMHQAEVSQRLREAIEFDLQIIYIDETSFTREEGRNYG